MSKIEWNQKLALYDQLVQHCPRFERKGKTMPYTSANGHMFSLLNKKAEFGMRFSKEVQEDLIQKLDSSLFYSHGAALKGYVQIPDTLWKDQKQMIEYLNLSYDYVMSLEPK